MKPASINTALTTVAATAILLIAGCALPGSDRSPPTTQPAAPPPLRLERVTSAVPFPRGMAMKDGTLYVLSRGRVRDAGGTDVRVDDAAGTIWAVDPTVGEPVTLVPGDLTADTTTQPATGSDSPKATTTQPTDPSTAPSRPILSRVRTVTSDESVRTNARVLVAPTAPPFRLLDRSLPDAMADTRTDRPYCILRYDDATKSFYFCAFSGIDKPLTDYGGAGDRQYFRKNDSDAVYRYDTRSRRWHLMYRGAADPVHRETLSGPNNCLIVGAHLYVVGKESSTLVRFDLSGLRTDPFAKLPPPERIAGRRFKVGGKDIDLWGHSMLAERDGYLYLGFRTSGAIIRIKLPFKPTAAPYRVGVPLPPIEAELVAVFDPFDPATGHTSDLTDMAFGPDGALHVVSAKPARVYRFTPDPRKVYDARTARATTRPGTPLDLVRRRDNAPYNRPWADLSAMTGNPKMKIESVLVGPAGEVYITSADRAPGGTPAEAPPGASPGLAPGLAGVVYRILPGPDVEHRP